MKFKKELLDYRGLKLQVPEEARCIFTDKYGNVILSKKEPTILIDGGWCFIKDHVLMTINTNDSTDWQDSLVSFEPEYQQYINEYFAKTKTVDYLGHKFNVPEWATYMSIDMDGSVYAFENRPYSSTAANKWLYREKTVIRIELITKIRKTFYDWEETLREV